MLLVMNWIREGGFKKSLNTFKNIFGDNLK